MSVFYIWFKRKILFSYVITFPAVRLWLEYSFNLELNVIYIIRLLLFGSRLLKKVTRYASFVYFITKIWFDSPFMAYARYHCYVVRHYSDMSVSFTCAVCIPMSIAFNSSSTNVTAGKSATRFPIGFLKKPYFNNIVPKTFLAKV